jgi:hypothetical protein
MNAKILIVSLFVFALSFGAVLWYFQTQAYYSPVTLQAPSQPQVVVTQTPTPSLDTEEVLVTNNTSGGDEAPTLTQPSLSTPIDTTASLPWADTTSIAATGTGTSATTITLDSLSLTHFFTGERQQMLFSDFTGIDASTSPLKFRGCFTTPMSFGLLTETYTIYDEATPLRAPRWFDCFDVETLTEDLSSGVALAFLGHANIIYGIDRVIAVYPEGNAYVWHQINACGEAAFAGQPLPSDCPPKP